jgi:hypothetical protein
LHQRDVKSGSLAGWSTHGIGQQFTDTPFEHLYTLHAIRDSRTFDMRTVIETSTFQKIAAKLWTDEERVAFIDWIAVNPLAGDVIPGADGARKVRWSCAGSGKSGGARVIYFNLTEDEIVLLVTIYAKAERANISPAEISKVV